MTQPEPAQEILPGVSDQQRKQFSERPSRSIPANAACC